MRHHNVNRKFGREKKPREAFIRSLASSLIMKGKISTTLPRAKEIRPFVEKLVTRAKNPTLANTRILVTRLGTDDMRVSKKLIAVAEGYKGRAGGYLRITKTGFRQGDAAPKAVIEFV
ncbi:MAG: 50S ribosomal protein L17 [Candidatus Pacebacteria bacterium]|nr:50S ribosomal protein L17 [Candidatus Paceibacterota bacterium]